MNTYILAIDQGTTSTRAIIFDHEMHIVGIAQRELMNYYPHPGWVEQNANDIWASCVGVIGEVMAKCNIADEPIKEKLRLYGIKRVVSQSILRSFGNPDNPIPILKIGNKKVRQAGFKKKQV